MSSCGCNRGNINTQNYGNEQIYINDPLLGAISQYPTYQRGNNITTRGCGAGGCGAGGCSGGCGAGTRGSISETVEVIKVSIKRGYIDVVIEFLQINGEYIDEYILEELLIEAYIWDQIEVFKLLLSVRINGVNPFNQKLCAGKCRYISFDFILAVECYDPLNSFNTIVYLLAEELLVAEIRDVLLRHCRTRREIRRALLLIALLEAI